MSLLKSWLQRRKSIDKKQEGNDQRDFGSSGTNFFYGTSLTTGKSTKKLEKRPIIFATNSIPNVKSSSTLPPLSTKTARRNFLTFYRNYGTGSKNVFSRKTDEGLLNSVERHQQQNQYDDDRQNNDELITFEKNLLEERRRQALDDNDMEKNRQQTYDELEKALRLLADEFQPLVARSTPKNYDHYKNSSAESNSMKSDDTSSSNFDQKSMQHCLFEQPVYDHMIEDSLKTVHQLKNSLDLLAASCTTPQERT
uniref:Uncharacterized protein n=1 Tax=Romanomermis culicivorax TaxID=13658 RepID=A0A915IQZ2_ROMCU